MREQLIRYIDLLFAGTPHAADIKQEILQNTLDRYDDLTAQGKSPEAAYSLAISGIGDVSELLVGTAVHADAGSAPVMEHRSQPIVPIWKKFLRAAAICLYILSPIPLFVLAELSMETIGLCGTIGIVAVATALMVISGGRNSKPSQKQPAETADPRTELRRAARAIIWAIGICVYFVLSFTLGAWYITWVVFPLTAAVQGLVIACMDLKEAQKYEN